MQGDILKIFVQIVCDAPSPVHLSKVKSHTGIAVNECADAQARYQTRQADMSHADAVMPCASIGGNPSRT